ncbi:uncharacterized protein [Halyomorpha halys]|uniref:uncharacterized protein n=1 Tax=Halyomorpha halys TaxID=286706 RepID=UPI0006D4E67B
MSRHGPFPITHSSAGRNPWSGGGESVSSSASSQTYHAIPHQYLQTEKYWTTQTPVPVPPPLLTHLLPPNHQSVRLPPQGSRATSSRAVTPQSSPTETVILPCGGHCVLFEAFCHRFLQVALAGGVVSGSILTGAGLLAGPDAGPLAYIGSLTALVSALLLAVQVRSRPRRRPHRQPLREEIPLRDISSTQCQSFAQPSPPSFREESGIPWWRRENID